MSPVNLTPTSRSHRGTLTLGLVLTVMSSCVVSTRCENQTSPQPPAILRAEDVLSLNAVPEINRPSDAEAPSQFSVDHEAHRIACNFQAPGIAVVPLVNGRNRIWLSWYQQNNNPGGAAIGKDSAPYGVYAYSDDPFGTTEPIWHRAFSLVPERRVGDETASDPEVALLADGRLLGSYVTSNHFRCEGHYLCCYR